MNFYGNSKKAILDSLLETIDMHQNNYVSCTHVEDRQSADGGGSYRTYDVSSVRTKSCASGTLWPQTESLIF